jgi:uncharacterized protein
MPYDAPPDLASLSLEEIARLVETRGLPPVEQWSPQHVGDSRMRIAADGRWYHDGSVIRRPAMVRAFASLLWRDEQGQHWLVTPYEKQAIAVEDAAFIATDVKQAGDALAFRLNTDDLVIAGPDHPIVARGSLDEPAIYLAVRHRTEARLNRSTWAQLAEIALDHDAAEVTSLGMTFPLTP